MTESDDESDEEFQATFENELLNHPQHDAGQRILELLTTQIASGRVDRVERILLLLMRFPKANSVSQTLLDEFIYHALSQAASRGNIGAIRMICRITAGYGFSFAKEQAAIRMLIFQDENPSCVEALQQLGFEEGFNQAFDLVKKARAHPLHLCGRCRSIPQTFTVLQRNFFFAALRGDLEEVKRILNDPQTDLQNVLDVHACDSAVWFSNLWLCSSPLCAAAARSQWKVVKTILEEAESMATASGSSHRNGPRGALPWIFWITKYSTFFYRVVVIIAAQRNDFSIFSEMFAELENAISDVSFLSDLFREAQPEFMEKVMSLCKLRLQHNRAMDVDGTFLQELKYIFSEEIRTHACPRHLDYLMQEIFAQTFVSVKVLAPFLLDLLLATKRVSVVKRVLLFKPRFFMDDGFLDLEDYKFYRCSESLWARGARLLVEAGVKASSPVPAEHTELFSLSLQSRCLITVRGCLKLPVRESVQKLPLFPSLKRRLLYRF